MGLLHFSTGRGGTLEGGVPIILPGKVVNIGARMPGIRLVVQNAEG